MILDRRVPPVTTGLVVATLTMSIAVAVDARSGGELYRWVALWPEGVWRGEVWRLLTWPLVMGGPLSLIFTCVALVVFGTDLALAWGVRRYLRYLAGVVLVAGIGTSVVGLAWADAREVAHLGGMVVTDALAIAWARQFPENPVYVYFVLLVRGRALVTVVVGVTVVFALYLGVAWTLPELLAVGAALLWGNRAVRRRWLEAKLAWTRRNLRVVRGGRG